MRSISILSLSTVVGMAALALLGPACTSEVIVDDEQGLANQNASAVEGEGASADGASAEGDDTDGDDTDGDAPSDALAILYSQLQGNPAGGDDPSGSGSSSSSGGGGPDPSTLFLIVGDPALTCSDPYGSYDCGSWRVSIGVPPALQVPGEIDLSDPALISNFSVQGPDEGGGSCWGGGGSFWIGKLEIKSIDATEVQFEIKDTETFHFDANGDYSAPRCP